MMNFTIAKDLKSFLFTNSYELLLAALLFHLYGSLFFHDVYFYGKYIRVINTVFLYFAATNSFFHRENKISKTYGILLSLTFFLNLILLNFNESDALNGIRNICVLLFLSLTLFSISRFLFSPHRLDKALISASVAGYLLIIEIAVRTFLILYLTDGSHVLNNIDFSYHTKTFIDTTYFCTVTITSIGFGDILPISHNAKMVTSLLGLTGQFYLVVIMGIMVNKFVTHKQ